MSTPKPNIFTGLILISIAAVLTLPLYIIFYLEPAFIQFITENTEKEAIKVGRHMTTTFFPDSAKLTKMSIGKPMITELTKLQDEFNIIKVKIFTPEGDIIYSTTAKDIGEVNTHDYFLNTVAKGGIFTKVVQKNNTSMEGQTMPVDVVETYVPIMHGTTFLGAFEIYYDITAQKHRLNTLALRGQTIAIIIAALFLLAIFILIQLALKNIHARKAAEDQLKKAHDELEERVDKRTAELTKVNETLKKEVQTRLEAEQEKEELIGELTVAMTQVKTLSGMLPICSSCQQIRDIEGKWSKVEDYIQTRTDAEFTHGICPKCAQRLYPDLYDKISEE